MTARGRPDNVSVSTVCVSLSLSHSHAQSRHFTVRAHGVQLQLPWGTSDTTTSSRASRRALRPGATTPLAGRTSTGWATSTRLRVFSTATGTRSLTVSDVERALITCSPRSNRHHLLVRAGNSNEYRDWPSANSPEVSFHQLASLCANLADIPGAYKYANNHIWRT
jgi:hypothetical protein